MLPIVSLDALRVISATVVLVAQPASDTVVRVASSPRYPGIATLVAELSIGTATGAAEYSFTRVSDVLPMPDGSVIIVDVPIGATGGRGRGNRATTAVRWYDADGRFIRALGRSGQGPGEHLNPSGLARLPDGRILLRDASLHRINVYSSTGESLDTWRIDERTSSTSSGSGRLMVDKAGIIYLRARETVSPAQRATVAGPFNESVIRLRSDGRVIDTLEVPPASNAAMMRSQLRSSSISMSVPFTPWSMWQWSPLGYFVTAFGGRYAVDLRVPPPARGTPARPSRWEPGDPVISIRRNAAPVPIPDAERAAHRSWTEAVLRTRDSAWTWNGPEVPRVKPPIRHFVIGEDGRIWVMASLAAERFSPPPGVARDLETSIPFREPPIYEVLDPDGIYVGRVRLPEGVTLQAMRGDTIWGTTKDADDVPTVTRFRIDWR
jgi:hypothetical protein